MIIAEDLGVSVEIKKGHSKGLYTIRVDELLVLDEQLG